MSHDKQDRRNALLILGSMGQPVAPHPDVLLSLLSFIMDAATPDHDPDMLILALQVCHFFFFSFCKLLRLPVACVWLSFIDNGITCAPSQSHHRACALCDFVYLHIIISVYCNLVSYHAFPHLECRWSDVSPRCIFTQCCSPLCCLVTARHSPRTHFPLRIQPPITSSAH